MLAASCGSSADNQVAVLAILAYQLPANAWCFTIACCYCLHCCNDAMLHVGMALCLAIISGFGVLPFSGITKQDRLVTRLAEDAYVLMQANDPMPHGAATIPAAAKAAAKDVLVPLEFKTGKPHISHRAQVRQQSCLTVSAWTIWTSCHKAIAGFTSWLHCCCCCTSSMTNP